MTISFNQVPNNIRVPGAYIEIDATRANRNLQQETRILVIGQRLTTGTVAASVPTLVTSYAQAVDNFGQGSMLANMFETLFTNNPYTEKWCVALDDNGAGAKATGTIVVTGPATETGTISLYCGGVLVEVSVASGDASTAIASAINAAVNANLDLPVTSGVSSSTVTLTYRHKGLVGNKYDVRVNYRGALAGESLPAGVGLTITQVGGVVAGTSDPDISTAISALPEEVYDFWLVPYISSGVLDDLDTELDSRWGPLRMLEGHVFTADKGSVGTLSTLGNTRNNPHMTILDATNNSPTPPLLWAAALCGQVSFAATNDPARPFQTLQLVNVKACPPEDRRTLTERNTLLYDGIATHFITKTGNVQAERIVTTYQTNAFDVADGAYLDSNTPLTLAYLRKTLRARITTKFPRYKLADDGIRFGAGSAIVTPKVIKAEIIALAKEWEELGYVENIAQFKRELIVERSLTDRNRVDVMLPPDLINQFIIFAAQISFIL
jgi:phage tail sheath gpL-like